ncbi:Tricarboxylate transport sensor protein TctE [hydrothermal vent metagenome]|uniref:histidine kinase n=1 Tax=hydrothermal vent metagenome TaxID=652676 RepID=A0A3B0UXA9_9ZZZZ
MNGAVNSSGSIRRRLSIQLVGSAAILATILFMLVQNFARQVSEQSQDNILTASATSILDSASISAGEVSIDIPYAALSMLGNVSEDRVFYRIDAGNEFLTGYSDLPRISQQSNEPERSFITADYKNDSIRMVSATRQMSVQGEPIKITVSVAQTRNGQREALAQISRTALILGLGFFVISAALAMLAAQSSVRPLQRLAESVSRRGPKDLRPVQSPVPAEMTALVASLNSFIARLKKSLSRSEDFIAEAAHRVRTPLATVRVQAEVALRQVEKPKNRNALKEMIRAIDESSRAAGQLLDHAMVTFRTDHLEREKLDLGDLVLDAVERMRPVGELRDIEIDILPGGGGNIWGDPILIQSAIHNILDNAIKYSPPDSTITVKILQKNDGIQVEISDRGPGFPTSNIDRLTNRFIRGDNAADTVGSGLGLTIAKEVAEAHAGKIILKNQQQGAGACVSLFFSF